MRDIRCNKSSLSNRLRLYRFNECFMTKNLYKSLNTRRKILFMLVNNIDLRKFFVIKHFVKTNKGILINQSNNNNNKALVASNIC